MLVIIQCVRALKSLANKHKCTVDGNKFSEINSSVYLHI